LDDQASNYPHRGGKSSPFEGGVRVSAFVVGGLLPPKMHGRVFGSTSQIIHVADWCMLRNSCK
jgi:arylsulfatase I/J